MLPPLKQDGNAEEGKEGTACREQDCVVTGIMAQPANSACKAAAMGSVCEGRACIPIFQIIAFLW